LTDVREGWISIERESTGSLMSQVGSARWKVYFGGVPIHFWLAGPQWPLVKKKKKCQEEESERGSGGPDTVVTLAPAAAAELATGGSSVVASLPRLPLRVGRIFEGHHCGGEEESARTSTSANSKLKVRG
jgi:hypothetical protein